MLLASLCRSSVLCSAICHYVLNKLIRNKSRNIKLSEQFLENGEVIRDKTEIAEGFNNFFVNVGPKLAEEIIPPKDGAANQFYEKRNHASIFLREVEQNEIMEIVHHFKSKKSTDWNGNDMYLIKQVIHTIIVPLTHICNLSLKGMHTRLL